MKKSAILILFSCFLTVVHAHENKTESSFPIVDQTKNIVFSNAEFYLIGGAVNLSYERYIFTRNNFDFSLRGTYGRWLIGGGLGEGGPDSGSLFKLTGNKLYFQGNHHMELDLGFMVLINDEKSGIPSILPDVFFGYTYKKPDGHFVFKTGIGILGVLSVGMGYAF